VDETDQELVVSPLKDHAWVISSAYTLIYFQGKGAMLSFETSGSPDGIGEPDDTPILIDTRKELG
jgi:hypothetical protein